MTTRSIGLSDELNSYLAAHSSRPDDVRLQLITRTLETSAPGMQIAPEQGEFLAMVTSMLNPSFVVEVGTFTGYSSLSIAQSLGSGGRLLCCDVNAEWTSIAREHWEAAGVAGKIELRLGPAIETLRALPLGDTIDLAFIDADKEGYVDYYEEILQRLGENGVILVDNTLWSGAVVDESDTSEATMAIRRFNDYVTNDQRTRQVILPIGDGLTMIRRA